MADPDFDQVISIAKEAGVLAMRGWTEGEISSDVWEKTPGHIVSSIDIAVNDLLKEHLGKLLPEAGWLSEETADGTGRLAKDLAWVVDPIDGTKDFVKGRRGWAVSIALVQNGTPVFGVLNAPAMDEIWVAKAGQFTRMNDEPLSASKRESYSGARIPVDQLPDGSVLEIVEKPNSIALRMAMVAADRADLVATVRWGHEWDIAAAHVIAAEAGASVTDAFGETLRYNGSTGQAFGVLCCAQGIYGEATEHLSRIAKEILARD